MDAVRAWDKVLLSALILGVGVELVCSRGV